MNCKNCKALTTEKPLYRTNPKGQLDAGWMCEDCIKTQEPELYSNLKEEKEFEIVGDIFNVINSKK